MDANNPNSELPKGQNYVRTHLPPHAQVIATAMQYAEVFRMPLDAILNMGIAKFYEYQQIHKATSWRKPTNNMTDFYMENTTGKRAKPRFNL